MGWGLLLALLAALVGAALTGCASTSPQRPEPPSRPATGGSVLSVTLTAFPATYQGACPASITFIGEIVTDGPAVVEYVFTRSDDASDPIVKKLTFARAGSKQTAAHTWLLGGAVQRFAGRQALRILTPNQLESEPAQFTVDCEEPPP